jgi:gluconolactonase
VGTSAAGFASDFLHFDARLDGIVDPGFRLEKVVEDHEAFFEGPVWVATETGGHLLFTDIAGDAILKWEPGGTLGTVAHSFFASSRASRARDFDLGFRRVRLKGPDGLAIDSEGRIVYCGYGPRHVGRLEPDGRRTVLAESYEGRRLNTPNDVVVRSDGTVYFTDSSADLVSAPGDADAGVPTSALYRVQDGRLKMLHADFTAANGLAFSPDERHLYVNDTRRKLVWRFEAPGSGPLGRRELFADMNSDPSDGVPDGMKVDADGNVYCTGPRGLWIIAADGTHLGTLLTPERLTNLVFGGPDRTTLYMTGPSYVWRIRLRVRGASQSTRS